jgi:hypothetical protein
MSRTGPANRQHLKAKNLAKFSQTAEGVDEVTCLLRHGDDSDWFRSAVADRYLAGSS